LRTLRCRWSERRACDSEPGVLGLAPRLEVRQVALQGVHGNRESDADIALAGALNLLVDPDDLALEIEERPTGVSRIDGGVGLDHVRDEPLLQAGAGSTEGADDPQGHRPL